MSDTGFKKGAYCGLYCGSCACLMATEKGYAAELGIPECKGCKSDHLKGEWCSQCTLKACAKEKGVEFCYQCDEYPCKPLEDFKNDTNYPYHSEVFDYMKIILENGETAWQKEMAKRWSCPECGTPFNWWTLQCNNCGAKTSGYVNPQE